MILPARTGAMEEAEKYGAGGPSNPLSDMIWEMLYLQLQSILDARTHRYHSPLLEVRLFPELTGSTDRHRSKISHNKAFSPFAGTFPYMRKAARVDNVALPLLSTGLID